MTQSHYVANLLSSKQAATSCTSDNCNPSRTASETPTEAEDSDTIIVARAQAVYVFGQVKSPGAYPIERDTTVLQALSLAGGVTDRGSTGRIKIVRTVDGKKKEIKVKLTDVVEPGDTVIVAERFF